MQRRIVLLTAALGALTPGSAAPQEPQSGAFEVASIKIAVTPERQPMICLVPCAPGERLTVEGARVDIRFMSLTNLIVTAYRIKRYQLSGPDWMRTERFDIMARLPAGGSREQVPEMLQALLAERFHLTLHRDRKELPVFALIVGKNGLKLTASEANSDAPLPDTPGSRAMYTPQGEARADGSGNVTVSGGTFGPFRNTRSPSGIQTEMLAVTMPGIAELVAPHVDRPVVDLTGLKGSYRFVWELPAPTGGGGGRQAPGAAGPDAAAPTLTPFDEAVLRAVENAGLKLDARRTPVEVLVIDRLEKTPTGN